MSSQQVSDACLCDGGVNQRETSHWNEQARTDRHACAFKRDIDNAGAPMHYIGVCACLPPDTLPGIEESLGAGVSMQWGQKV